MGIHLDKATSCVGAVIVNSNGLIQAIWASYASAEKKAPTTPTEFYRGMHCYLLNNTIKSLQNGNL